MYITQQAVSQMFPVMESPETLKKKEGHFFRLCSGFSLIEVYERCMKKHTKKSNIWRNASEGDDKSSLLRLLQRL